MTSDPTIPASAPVSPQRDFSDLEYLSDYASRRVLFSGITLNSMREAENFLLALYEAGYPGPWPSRYWIRRLARDAYYHSRRGHRKPSAIRFLAAERRSSLFLEGWIEPLTPYKQFQAKCSEADSLPASDVAISPSLRSGSRLSSAAMNIFRKLLQRILPAHKNLVQKQAVDPSPDLVSATSSAPLAAIPAHPSNTASPCLHCGFQAPSAKIKPRPQIIHRSPEYLTMIEQLAASIPHQTTIPSFMQELIASLNAEMAVLYSDSNITIPPSSPLRASASPREPLPLTADVIPAPHLSQQKMNTLDKTTPANADLKSSPPKAESTTLQADRMLIHSRQPIPAPPQANLWQTACGVISRNRPLRRDLTAKGRIPAITGRFRLAARGLRLLLSSILPSPSLNAEKAMLQAEDEWWAAMRRLNRTWRSHPQLDRWGTLEKNEQQPSIHSAHTHPNSNPFPIPSKKDP